mmetsp:Transcript_4784/g.9132  ORF Transcript_4784/g.9132 Transcript_4784/m.9132 type:complete len:475 (-) Transcript_4784:68-1492(-)
MKIEVYVKIVLLQRICFKSLPATATFLVTTSCYSSKKYKIITSASMSRTYHDNRSDQDSNLKSDEYRFTSNNMMNTRCSLAFDAHNHIQLSKPGGIPPLSEHGMAINNKPCDDDEIIELAQKMLDSFTVVDPISEEKPSDGDEVHPLNTENVKRSVNAAFPKVGGLAIMSTQPRDFPVVEQLRNAIHLLSTQRNSVLAEENHNQQQQQHVQIVVPCYGVHPWFLNQANKDFSTMTRSLQGVGCESESGSDRLPAWLPYLREKLQSDPQSHLGEIGLDGARYKIDPITQQKVLVSSMEDQIVAFEAQMHLAADLKKSVSIHAVQCWGPFMDSLKRIKFTRIKMRREKRSLERKNKDDNGFLLLPPKIYFHAFGGKAAVVDQLDAICKDKSMESSFASETFYGFAPVINFRSPKTASVMHRVGIDRLILETDLEDYQGVREDVKVNAEFAAEVFHVELDEVLRRTFENACRLYNIS